MSNHKVHLIRQSLHLDLLLLRPVKSLQGVRVEDAVLEADQRTRVPEEHPSDCKDCRDCRDQTLTWKREGWLNCGIEEGRSSQLNP